MSMEQFKQLAILYTRGKNDKVSSMETYRSKFVLLNKSNWNFSMVNDELDSISTCNSLNVNAGA